MAVDERRQQAGDSGTPSGASLRRRRSDQLLPPPAPKLPLPLLVLDGIGAALIGLGAAEHFGAIPLLSRIIAVPNVALLSMGAGVALMAIAVAGIVVTVMRRKAQRP